MSLITRGWAALAMAAACLLTACEGEAPTEPVRLDIALAKPGACPGHPSCDDDDGGDPPAATMLLSGGYNEDPDGTAQPVTVGQQGRIRSIGETASGVGVGLLLPEFSEEPTFAALCIHKGFGDATEAMAFWNEVADHVGSAFKFLARMDTRSMGSNDTEHVNEVAWNDGQGIPEGNITKFRVGNHSVYGAARWSGSEDTYTITEGGVTLSVLGGAGNHELVGVACDNRPNAAGGLGASFTIDLQ